LLRFPFNTTTGKAPGRVCASAQALLAFLSPGYSSSCLDHHTSKMIDESIIPRGAVPAAVGKNNCQSHQDQYGNSFENKNNIRHTVFSAHDNGDPVSCLSAITDAPTSVLVG